MKSKTELVPRPAIPPAFGKETAQWILDKIRAEPELHDQTSFLHRTECGTTRCIAGWAAFLHDDYARRIPRFTTDFTGVNPDGILVHVAETVGRKSLELSVDDMLRLFYQTTNAQAVHALEYLAKGDAIDWKAVLGRE